MALTSHRGMAKSDAVRDFRHVVRHRKQRPMLDNNRRVLPQNALQKQPFRIIGRCRHGDAQPRQMRKPRVQTLGMLRPLAPAFAFLAVLHVLVDNVIKDLGGCELVGGHLLVLEQFFDVMHRIAAGEAIGISDILRHAKSCGLKARCLASNWKRLQKTPLPAIACYRNGGFFILAKVADDRALIQDPLERQPKVVNRSELEAMWDLWTPEMGGGLDTTWRLQPQPVKFLVYGTVFEDGIFQQDGHVEIDFGLDTPFLYEELELDQLSEERVKANVQKLVAFTAIVEKNAGIRGRILWSDSEENLVQKLIARLQKVQ